MITAVDSVSIEKLAPVAQLLEMMGQYSHEGVRSSDVFTSMAKDVWRVYLYLSARFSDEMVGGAFESHDEEYFRKMKERVDKAVDET